MTKHTTEVAQTNPRPKEKHYSIKPPLARDHWLSCIILDNICPDALPPSADTKMNCSWNLDHSSKLNPVSTCFIYLRFCKRKKEKKRKNTDCTAKTAPLFFCPKFLHVAFCMFFYREALNYTLTLKVEPNCCFVLREDKAWFHLKVTCDPSNHNKTKTNSG